ncbi:MAG: hypothetical protein MJ009_05695 [Paludibacteraceae bacterium]|nr:hypothetical protein [Paludibacteraceae bacterium]
MKNLVNIKDAFFRGVKHCGKAMLLLVALTALSGSAWAATNEMSYWNLKRNSNWLNNDGYGFGETINAGVVTEFSFTAFWVKATFEEFWIDKLGVYYTLNGSDVDNYFITSECKACGYRVWESGDNVNKNLLSDSHINNPGDNTLGLYFQAQWEGSSSQEKSATVKFTLPGFSKTTATGSFGDVTIGADKSETISFTKHYGTALTASNCEIKGDGASSYSVTSINETGVTVKFQPNSVGSKPATLTITDAHGKKCTITLSGNATSSSTPTVLISKSEKVEGQEVTLSGYLKYTGCKTIKSVGFIISQNLAEVEDGTAQVYNATTAPDAPIAAMSDFSLFSDEFENEVTYYYKAWMKASDETVTLSEETRSFTPAGVCNITGAASVLPIFESGKITESATFASGSASINLKVDKNCIADVYQWNVKSQPDDSHVGFVPDWQKRNVSITVDKVGTYTFTLSANCSGSAQVESSRVLTLYVCEPAETTQLYLDNHTNNVLCVGEKATATCITKEGYTYSLYNPSGDNLGSLAGTGGTQTWRNVEGAGEFTMRTSPTTLPQCAAIVSSATQRYNEPTMEITADPGLSVLSYQPVILSKKDVESPTYVDTDPTWVITNGSDKAYLLNEHNRLAYDNRARESVVFKAGAGSATQITVAASAYKTVEVPDASGNYTKQCPATVDVTLTVSPAVDDCD